MAVALPSCPQPKPCPVFGHAPTSDDENSLPAPTLASILADANTAATAASKAALGKRAGYGTKVVRVKRGLGKRKARAESESEDGVVKGKVGRSHGAVNW